MANVIKHKRGTSKPSPSDLAVGEIGIDTALAKLFTENDAGYVWEAGELLGSFSGSTITYTVTVASKTSAHRYNGTGSGSGYKINGVFAPFLNLTPGNTYRFDTSHSSNSNHPFKFYLEANKSTLYSTGVTINGTAGQSGSYTEITISDTTPLVLHYQCAYHGYMGNSVLTNSKTVNYNDLQNKPSLFSGNYNDLSNQPSLFSGSYNDLSNKPSLFSGSYNDLSDKPTIPTNNNQLTNGAGYITSYVNTQLSNEQVQDIVGGMVSSNSETNITVDYDDASGKLNFSSVNTTYSVGDGGLTQNNFTNALKSKLDNIENNATADQSNSEIKTAYEANSDTNAFTDALLNKLNGIAASANNYSISADLLDEDNMASNSATKVPSQQSVKAYVDANSSDTTYSAGNGLSLSGTTFSVDQIALTTVQTAASESAQLALTTQEGDIVVRTDQNKSYVRNSGTAGTMADFTELLTPTDQVLSVNGNTGAITAAQIAAAVEAASNSNTFTDADHSKLNNIEAQATADQTAAEILALLLGVDGAGSNLDSDKLDGQQGSYYLDYNNFSNTPTIPTNNNQLTNGAGYVTANTQLSTEQVQDIVGAMFTGNSETNITATYQDSDGTIDLSSVNTTYSVGDGGLTQKNFTTALKDKLDGIAAGATNTAAPYYTSAIAVGDGGLTQKNFTTTLKNKLDGIAAGANNITNNNQLTNGAGYVTQNTQLSNEQVQDIVGAMVSSNSETNISVTYDDTNGKLNFSSTNTTYSVGDGGLTQKNFTTTLKNKLDGIAAGATNTAAPYYTSAIAVGDGGLTQKNFTTTLKNKLDGIAAGANNYTFPHTVSVAASNSTVVQRHSSGYIFANYFNTTPNDVSSGVTKVCVETGNDGYIRHGSAAAIRSFINVANGATNTAAPYYTSAIAVGDGGLTQKNFTTTLKNKLDGIAAGANNITNNNQLTNGAGYITSVSGQNYNSLSNKPTIPTNNNQLTNGAGYVTSSGNTIIGTDSDINTSGATVIDQLNMTDGVITSHSTRTLTLANLGYTGATNANYITNNNQLSNGAGYSTYSSNQATNTNSSVTFGSITSSGNITAYSDLKLKTEIHTIKNSLDMVSKLRGVNYKWLSNNQADIGVIAQEVEEVLPEVVKETDDGIKTVDYGRMVCVLIESIKELNAKVKILEGKN